MDYDLADSIVLVVTTLDIEGARRTTIAGKATKPNCYLVTLEVIG